jgi:hypothetical protein
MANKIYTAPESTIVFADSAQTPDETLTLANLAAGSARISARHDRGAGARATLFEWRASCQFAATGTVGETIDLFVSSSDGTHPDGEEGTADAALSSTEKLRNLIYAGSIVVDVTTANADITASGVVRVPARYLSIVVHNNTSQALRNDTSVHRVSLTPIPDELQ